MKERMKTSTLITSVATTNDTCNVHAATLKVVLPPEQIDTRSPFSASPRGYVLTELINEPDHVSYRRM